MRTDEEDQETTKENCRSFAHSCAPQHGASRIGQIARAGPPVLVVRGGAASSGEGSRGGGHNGGGEREFLAQLLDLAAGVTQEGGEKRGRRGEKWVMGGRGK